MKPKDMDVLKQIAAYEDTTPEKEWSLGWSWRDVAGVDEKTVQLPPTADVRALLERLGEGHGAALADRVLRPDGTTWPSIAILLNGSNISLKQGLDTPLAEGDAVAIVPVIAGGG